MALLMATTVWHRVQGQALDAVRSGAERDVAARRLLATAGGDRRMVLAARLRLAAIAAGAPDAVEPRQALALVDRAIALADTDDLWHPVFGERDIWRFARNHAAP